jgi:hypothetical protein
LLTGRLPGEEPPAGRYRLEAASSALVGCLDLCDCAIHEIPDLDGAFTIEPVEAGATFTRYRVDGIEWVIGTEKPLVARGAGEFEVRLEGAGEVESFDLELTIAGEAPQRFRSEPRVRDEGRDEIVASVRPAELVCAGQVFQLRARRIEGTSFVRGDCNADGAMDAGDAVRLLFVIIGSAGDPPCEAACDANGDDRLNVADAVLVLRVLFASGPLPPAPFPACGPDDSPLGCVSFLPCP